MARQKRVIITFLPIPNIDGKGYVALEIHHPGIFDKTGYQCYVGGCGVGSEKTFGAAVSHLQNSAIEYCRRIVRDSSRKANFYQKWLDKLDTVGLEPNNSKV